jgi:hypothetical protein
MILGQGDQMAEKRVNPTPEQIAELAASPDPRTILERWEITIEELTELVDHNPSLRGVLLGYVAEYKLRKLWFESELITHSSKHDDHYRKGKGDLNVTYKGREFTIESKSLQTSMVRKEIIKGKPHYFGKAQCDASDNREITLPDGSKLKTTCLKVGEFDLLAVNIYAFEGAWRFLFAKNEDLPRSTFKGYTEEQRKHLLATLVPVSFPVKPPFREEPFSLLDELLQERYGESAPEMEYRKVAEEPPS